MVEEDSFVELTRECVRTCHVLKSVTEGSDVDDFGGSSENRIEDLGRWVNQAQSTPPAITSLNIRIIRRIEFFVKERANHPRDLRERRPESTEQYLIVWRTKMLDILRAFDVRCQ